MLLAIAVCVLLPGTIYPASGQTLQPWRFGILQYAITTSCFPPLQPAWGQLLEGQLEGATMWSEETRTKKGGVCKDKTGVSPQFIGFDFNANSARLCGLSCTEAYGTIYNEKYSEQGKQEGWSGYFKYGVKNSPALGNTEKDCLCYTTWEKTLFGWSTWPGCEIESNTYFDLYRFEPKKLCGPGTQQKKKENTCEACPFGKYSISPDDNPANGCKPCPGDTPFTSIYDAADKKDACVDLKNFVRKIWQRYSNIVDPAITKVLSGTESCSGARDGGLVLAPNFNQQKDLMASTKIDCKESIPDKFGGGCFRYEGGQSKTYKMSRSQEEIDAAEGIFDGSFCKQCESGFFMNDQVSKFTGACKCHGHQSGGGDGGSNCESIGSKSGKAFCYVLPGVCADSKPSSSEKMPDGNPYHHSVSACSSDSTGAGGITFSLEETNDWDTLQVKLGFKCKECPAGHYSDTKGASECTACAEGQYQPGTGKDECKSCVTLCKDSASFGDDWFFATGKCQEGEFGSNVGELCAKCTQCGKGTGENGDAGCKCDGHQSAKGLGGSDCLSIGAESAATGTPHCTVLPP